VQAAAFWIRCTKIVDGKERSMRRVTLAVAAIAAVAVLVAAARSIGTSAGQVVPTPKGQLGGAPSLATQPPAPTPPTPTPEPTATATPAASPSAGEDACDVAPRPLDELAQLAASPVAAPEPARWIGGTGADPATFAAIEATVRDYVACLNAGDVPRLAALATDRYARQLLAETGTDAGRVPSAVATVTPRPPAQRVRLIAVTEVIAAADGAVYATVILDGPTAIGTRSEQAFSFRFVRGDDRWLIDAVVPRPTGPSS
jgi:hypothetical protein